ncbi:MAG: hypothetical protein EXR61_05595 [Chloroflexi bacterium]|nr:hypothetical protein [Chloroflexota bacterium]
MMRRRHPKKEVEDALAAILEDPWWRLEQPRKTGHRWGVLKCGHNRLGCMRSVWGTPRNPADHARNLEDWAGQCAHRLLR